MPVRFGGLGIQDPSKTAEHEHASSSKVTEKLTELIYQQEKALTSLDYTKIKVAKDEVKNEKIKGLKNSSRKFWKKQIH